MKLKITGGTLEVEIADEDLISKIRKTLENAAEKKDTDIKKNIKESGTKDGRKFTGSLNYKPKIPI